MPVHQIGCTGEHIATPHLGTVELPADAPATQLAAAAAGYLCDDCGPAAVWLWSEYAAGRPGLPPRTPPNAAAVDHALAALGRPRHNPR